MVVMKIGQFKKEGKLKLIVIQKNNVYQNSLDQSPKSIDLISSLKEISPLTISFMERAESD